MIRPKDTLSPASVASEYEYLTLDLATLAEHTSTKRYGYGIGPLGLLVPVATLSEVLRQFVIYPLPNVQPWLRGQVNLRGNIIPVFDLAQLFGIDAEQNSSSYLLVLEKGPEAIGVMIDRLPVACEVEGWSATASVNDVPLVLAEYATEVYLNEGRLWISFDHKAFFSSMKDRVAL